MELERKNGDIWCLYLLFLKQHFPMEYCFVYDEFMKVEISEGRVWKALVERGECKSREQIYNSVVKVID